MIAWCGLLGAADHWGSCSRLWKGAGGCSTQGHDGAAAKGVLIRQNDSLERTSITHPQFPGRFVLWTTWAVQSIKRPDAAELQSAF